jgi:NADH-quinone oxidoreductase subunit L
MPISDLASNLAWLIPLFPFLSFLAISLFAYRNHVLSHRLAIGGVAIAFVLSQIVFWAAVILPVDGGDVPGDRIFESASISWLPAGVGATSLGVYIDPAAAVMLFTVPLLCVLIFIYSVGYMRGDPHYGRFFAYLSLCTAGMLGTVVFDNLLALFISLEIMGTCAYLLIGFQHEKRSAVQAGLKAFLVTKVGNVFLMLGLVLLYSEVDSLAYRDILDPETLEHLAHTSFLGDTRQGVGTQWSMATVIALLLFGGTIAKSAQFPLHVWLPDAMVAPTPASALIHAATVDSAGIFLMMRVFPLFTAVEGGPHMTIVVVIGTLTAALTAVIAVAQNDIKQVLAFSTISQLGYMVVAIGIGAYVAGAFHLITHAFFKALLFLSLGSVTHGMERGHRHVCKHYPPTGDKAFDSHDMMTMGGLAKRMPRTFWTFLIGGLTLSSFPLITAGFWSKHEILDYAYKLSPPIFWILTVTAGLTSFYSVRQICLAFLGSPRTKAAEHASESAFSMTAPLVILAAFSVSLGWIGIPENFPVIGGLIPNWLYHFVGSAIEAGPLAEHAAETRGAWHVVEASHEFVWQPLAIGLVFKLGAVGLGWLIYGRRPMRIGETDRVEAAMRRVWLGWLYDAMRSRFYLDEMYQATFVRGSTWLADLFHTIDRKVIDGLVNLVGCAGRGISEINNAFDRRVVNPVVDLIGLGTQVFANLINIVDLEIVDSAVDGVGDAIRAGGRFIRPIQTGRVQNYSLLAFLMLLAFVVTLMAILLLTT